MVQLNGSGSAPGLRPIRAAQPLTHEAVLRRLLVNNGALVLARTTLARQLAGAELGIDPPGRNLDLECGYPTAAHPGILRELYRRNGVAARVVNIWPDECFAVDPEVYETEKASTTVFERAYKEFTQRFNLAHYWHRVDRLSRIGQFGVLLLGVVNAGPLDRPLPGIDARTGEPDPRRRKELKIGYIRPFSEEFAKIEELEADPTSPRYGQPRYYQLTFNDPKVGNLGSTVNRRVHWSRVIHVAETMGDSNILAAPAMEPVLNYVLDLRKVSGASAEIYWRAAFPGYSVETLPDLVGEAVMDEDTIKEQFEEFSRGLKRYLAMDGVTVKTLTQQMADPTQTTLNLIGLICATIETPVRIFMGSESGHLASTQDGGNWNKRVAKRQSKYLDPFLVRATVDRLTAVGFLPVPASKQYSVAWKDLNTMSDKDRALVSLQKSQALQAYVAGGVEAVMALEEYLHLVLGFSVEEARGVVAAVNSRGKRLTLDPVQAKLQSKTAGAKKPARSPRGRPAGNIQRN